MANFNKVMLMGNITRDVQLSYLPNQTPICEIGLAVNRTWTGQDGVKKEEVTFVDCTSFGKQAELLAKYKKKGDPLFIEGRLKLDQWEAQDGTKRSKMRVVIENFQFLNRSAGPGMGAGPAAGGDEEYAAAPAPAQRQPYRQAARPAAAAPARPAPAPAPPAAPAQPNYDSDGPSQNDEAPPMKDEDIPF